MAHDSFFQGPRGWPYWNLLEYPKPIQNPNLWPDTQSTYFLSRFALPAGQHADPARPVPAGALLQACALQGRAAAPSCRPARIWPARTSLPDPGSTNPFVVGNNRLGEPRDYTVSIVAADAPEDAKDRRPNTLYAGTDGGELQMVMRIYLSDQGSDGAGWGPWASASAHARPADAGRHAGRWHAG